MLAADRFVRSGKVRDLYALDADRLLLVASDRLSAFDVVLPTPIPDKGRVLTGLSRFWFAETASIIPNHLLGIDPGEDAAPGRAEALRGRSMVCRLADVVPVEAVVRGYLAGSGWKEYRETGAVCGVELPSGLVESDRLPEPIFTPATKEEGGAHDVNISFDDMVDHLAAVAWLPAAAAGPVAEAIRDHALRLYRYGSAVAARAGILLADTKFEFGFVRDEGGDGSHTNGLTLVDEALTPDSSRFWDAATYEPDRPQASYDKQFVRNWLEAQGWDKQPPGPELPDGVVEGTRARYIEAYERITGASFARYLEEDVIAR
jgi:phosphoribosylaminoimidazole-succinocarboxamide synthase